jgi:hypothetical protein
VSVATPATVASPAAGLWYLAFRPFFLAAAVWAPLALTLWCESAPRVDPNPRLSFQYSIAPIGVETPRRMTPTAPEAAT